MFVYELDQWSTVVCLTKIYRVTPLSLGQSVSHVKYPYRYHSMFLLDHYIVTFHVVQLDNMSKEELIKLMKRQLQMTHKAKSKSEGDHHMGAISLRSCDAIIVL